MEDYVGEFGFRAKELSSIFFSFLIPRCKDNRDTLTSKLAAYFQANSFVSACDHRKSAYLPNISINIHRRKNSRRALLWKL
jgi:hypothetical protein